MPRVVVASIGLACFVLLAACDSTLSQHVGWPDERRPRVGADAGTLVVNGKSDYTMLGGIEGNQPFVKAAKASGGQIILEQHFQWPTTRERLPPGRYTITVYTKSCDGSCGYLDPMGSAFSCDLIVDLRSGARSVVVVGYTQQSLTCTGPAI